jgi:hypothetical protein
MILAIWQCNSLSWMASENIALSLCFPTKTYSVVLEQVAKEVDTAYSVSAQVNDTIFFYGKLPSPINLLDS